MAKRAWCRGQRTERGSLTVTSRAESASKLDSEASDDLRAASAPAACRVLVVFEAQRRPAVGAADPQADRRGEEDAHVGPGVCAEHKAGSLIRRDAGDRDLIVRIRIIHRDVIDEAARNPEQRGTSEDEEPRAREWRHPEQWDVKSKVAFRQGSALKRGIPRLVEE